MTFRRLPAPLLAFRLAIFCVVGLILLLLALLETSWWRFPSPATAAATPPKAIDDVRISEDQMHQLTLVEVELCSFQRQKPAIGQIAFNEDASTTVLAPFSGRITRLIARIGDEVKRNDPLFEIDSPEVVQAQTELIAAVHALEKSRAQFALTKRSLDRQEALLKDKATAQREVDQARNDHTAAESDLRTAEGALNAARNRLRVIIGRDREEIERVERERVVNPLLTVNAPIDGTVIARKIGPGQYVRSDAGEPLYTIADLSTMWLKAFVPEADIPFVRVGHQIEVKVAALPNQTFKARIIAVGAASDQQTRRVVVRSEIPNPDRVLKAEMFATFKISIGDPESAPAVPAEAVIRESDRATVWVQREPLVFQRRKVTLGAEQAECVQIRDGLKPGELVVGRGAVFVDNEWRQ
jgi:cobalt-zinc-cadmium efflux system membrane fusion protein